MINEKIISGSLAVWAVWAVWGSSLTFGHEHVRSPLKTVLTAQRIVKKQRFTSWPAVHDNIADRRLVTFN